mgnify:CR=1 FL=1
MSKINLGIIGGGQLGSMLSSAAKKLKIELENLGSIVHLVKADLNNLKQTIGVNKKTLEKYGAVSKNVALEMSVATLNLAKSDVCLSITGIAGPDGGSSEKPVGTVYFSCIDISFVFVDYYGLVEIIVLIGFVGFQVWGELIVLIGSDGNHGVG